MNRWDTTDYQKAGGISMAEYQNAVTVLGRETVEELVRECAGADLKAALVKKTREKYSL